MKRDVRIRIRRVDGTWYAIAKGPRKARNLALVPAINYCQRLNAKANGSASHG